MVIEFFIGGSDAGNLAEAAQIWSQLYVNLVYINYLLANIFCCSYPLSLSSSFGGSIFVPPFAS